MKKAHVALLLGLTPAMLLSQAAAEKNRVFTVKLGPAHQSSQFGLVRNRLQPYAGLDYFSASFSADIGMLMWSEDDATMELVRAARIGVGVDGSVSCWMPHVGAKYYLSDAESRPYVFGGVYRNFASVDASLDLAIQGYDPAGAPAGDPLTASGDLLSKEQKKFIESLLSHWGAQFGFGVEWRVNRHFGLAGEYGVKMHFNSAQETFEDSSVLDLLNTFVGGTDSDSDVSELLGADRTDLKLDLSGKLVTSQASVVLNFYF
jgi:hypothetical protein